MRAQLALDFGPEQLTGITHICLPNFSLACGTDFLDRPKGDRVLFGWGQTAPTCVWCRSLGRVYCRHLSGEMQRRQA